MTVRKEISGIQYLRGFAATTVVLYHSAAMAAMPKYFGTRLAGGIFERGDLGVDLFFLISGFIIAVVSLDGPLLSPSITMRAFFGHRFVRIVPLMWIAIIAFALLRLARHVWYPVEYLHALTLWPWGTVQPGHIWTLRQELIFYLVFAASMLTAPRWRFLMALWILGPVVLWLLAVPQTPGWADPIWLLLSIRNFEFAAGFVLAIVWLKRSRSLTIRLPVNAVLSLAMLTILAFYVVVPLFGIQPGLGMAILLMPILFLAIHVTTDFGRLHRLGDLLGNASYSIYLFHPPVVAAMLGFWAGHGSGIPLWLVVFSTAGMAVAVGIFLHFVLERPLIHWLRDRLGNSRRHPQGSALKENVDGPAAT